MGTTGQSEAKAKGTPACSQHVSGDQCIKLHAHSCGKHMFVPALQKALDVLELNMPVTDPL